MGSKWLIPLAVLGMAAGCATAGNTPAQQLAWERWKACDRSSRMTLDRIDLDGRLVVTGYETETGAFTACVREVAADQARRGAPSGPTVAVLVKNRECQDGAF